MCGTINEQNLLILRYTSAFWGLPIGARWIPLGKDHSYE